MKKLKLFGIKKSWFGIKFKKFIADIYVKDGKVIVESKYSKVKEELQKEIEKVAYTGAFRIPKHKTIEDEKGRLIEHQSIEFPQKPGDSQFLEAMVARSWFWHNRKFGGYEINELISKIIEE